MNCVLSDDFGFRIEFLRDGRWVLLVIDDDWREVRYMILGGQEFQGLGDRCLDSVAVSQYWADYVRPKGRESSVKSLLGLPALAFGRPSIAKIIFSPFPQDGLDASNVRDWAGENHSVATMVDVQKVTGSREAHEKGLEASWAVLDAAGVSPVYGRVILSKGFDEDAHDSRFRNAVLILKHYLGGDRAKAHFERWWDSVEGDLRSGVEEFGKSTGGQHTHEAMTLLNAETNDIERVLEAMRPLDAFGVWAWCREVVSERGFELQRRWHAAKCFYYSVIGDVPDKDTIPKKVPVLALVAVLSGIAMPHMAGRYTFLEGTRTISSADIEFPNRKCLGQLELKAGNYQEFMEALRRWLTHPEQHVKGNSWIVKAELAATEELVCLKLSYSAPLPEELLRATESSGRVGSAGETLGRLLVFCASWLPNESRTSLSLFFRAER